MVVSWRKILVVVTFFILSYAIYYYIESHATVESVRQNIQHFYDFSQQHYIVVLSLLFGAFVIATFFCIPITVLLTVTAGFLFGTIVGTVCSLLGVMVGGIFLFLATRWLFADAVRRRYADQLKKLYGELERHGHYYLLALQLFPFTPTCLVNTCAGVLGISLWRYSWTTAVGLLPGTMLYAWAGQKLHLMRSLYDIMQPEFIILFIVLALLAVLPIFFNRRLG